jgi:hypothetical protein
MIEVSLFVNKEHRDRMKREVVPREGETIILDCNEVVRVIEVSHQWDDPDFIQINAVPFPGEEILK